MFTTLSDRLAATFKNLRGKGRLSEADIDATAREIRIALLEADVALPVVKTFVDAVKTRARGEEVSGALNPAQQIVKIVNEELVTILGGETRRLRFAKTPPTVIMLAGLQGAGKTTLAAKLALWLKEQGSSPLLVAADLQRPNAVNQLQVNGERVGVKVFAPEPGNGVGDPVAVARAGVAEAKRTLHDVVIVDTAGRLGVDAEMMQQAADIRDAVNPDEILFVVDAMVGQDAVNTAQAFLDGVGYDGVVLTKLDGDARGGAALSIASITGKPVMFASAGEKPTDFDVFHPDRMAGRILDMGDMLTLIEQAEKSFDAEAGRQGGGQAHRAGGDFTLDDFLAADAAAAQDGLAVEDHGDAARDGAVPRAARELRRAGDRQDPGDHPVDDPRRAGEPQDHRRLPPVADLRGSGTQVSDVNALVDRFFEARKMMMSMAKGGGIPGMPGHAGRGTRRQARRRASRRRRRARPSASRATPRSGRAAEKASAERPRRGNGAAANPFGLPAGAEEDFDPSSLDLPADLSKYLK